MLLFTLSASELAFCSFVEKDLFLIFLLHSTDVFEGDITLSDGIFVKVLNGVLGDFDRGCPFNLKNKLCLKKSFFTQLKNFFSNKILALHSKNRRLSLKNF